MKKVEPSNDSSIVAFKPVQKTVIQFKKGAPIPSPFVSKRETLQNHPNTRTKQLTSIAPSKPKVPREPKKEERLFKLANMNTTDYFGFSHDSSSKPGEPKYKREPQLPRPMFLRTAHPTVSPSVIGELMAFYSDSEAKRAFIDKKEYYLGEVRANWHKYDHEETDWSRLVKAHVHSTFKALKERQGLELADPSEVLIKRVSILHRLDMNKPTIFLDLDETLVYSKISMDRFAGFEEVIAIKEGATHYVRTAN